MNRPIQCVFDPLGEDKKRINPVSYSVALLKKDGGQGWIRTSVLNESRFTVCRL